MAIMEAGSRIIHRQLSNNVGHLGLSCIKEFFLDTFDSIKIKHTVVYIILLIHTFKK